MSYQRRQRRASLGIITDPGGGITLPGQVRGFFDTVNSAVVGLNTDISGHQTQLAAAPGGPGFLQAWGVFKNDWGTWYGGHQGMTDAWWGSNLDQARSYADRYNGFERQYASLTGTAPSTPSAERVPPPPGAGGTDYLPYVIAGASVVGLIGVGYLLSQVAKIYGIHARVAPNRRRPRRRKRSS